MTGRYRNTLQQKSWLVDFLTGAKIWAPRTRETLQVFKGIPDPYNDNSVAKQVTDGDVWVKAVFTPAALKHFEEEWDDDGSPPDWDRSLIAVKECFIRHQFHPNKEQCEFWLVVDLFVLWDLQDGFRRKNVPVNCMQVEEIRHKSNQMWLCTKQQREQDEAGGASQAEDGSSTMDSIPLTQLLAQMGADSQADSQSQSQSQEHGASSQPDSTAAVQMTVAPSKDATTEGSRSDPSVVAVQSMISKRRATEPEEDPVTVATPSKTKSAGENSLVQPRQPELAATSATQTVNTALYPLSSDLRTEDFIISDHDQTILNNIPEWEPGYRPTVSPIRSSISSSLNSPEHVQQPASQQSISHKGRTKNVQLHTEGTQGSNSKVQNDNGKLKALASKTGHKAGELGERSNTGQPGFTKALAANVGNVQREPQEARIPTSTDDVAQELNSVSENVDNVPKRINVTFVKHTGKAKTNLNPIAVNSSSPIQTKKRDQAQPCKVAAAVENTSHKQRGTVSSSDGHTTACHCQDDQHIKTQPANGGQPSTSNARQNLACLHGIHSCPDSQSLCQAIKKVILEYRSSPRKAKLQSCIAVQTGSSLLEGGHSLGISGPSPNKVRSTSVQVSQSLMDHQNNDSRHPRAVCSREHQGNIVQQQEGLGTKKTVSVNKSKKSIRFGPSIEESNRENRLQEESNKSVLDNVRDQEDCDAVPLPESQDEFHTPQAVMGEGEDDQFQSTQQDHCVLVRPHFPMSQIPVVNTEPEEFEGAALNDGQADFTESPVNNLFSPPNYNPQAKPDFSLSPILAQSNSHSRMPHLVRDGIDFNIGSPSVIEDSVLQEDIVQRKAKKKKVPTATLR